METLLFILLASVFNTFLFLVGGSGALRDVEIVMPKYIRRGEDVQLACKYNLDRDQLYAVNWYKGGQEFYRYVPKEAPPQKAFQRLGSYVDVRKSNDHDVFLKNVSLDVSGLYKCSATAEGNFETLSSSNEMTVVVIGDDMPSVQLDRAQYHPGDPVTVECQSPYSFPPANITWFYNDTKVGPEREIKTELRKSSTDPVTQSRLSRFSFDLPEKLPASTVSIKCRVTVFTLYDQNYTTPTIETIPRRLTGTETLLRGGTSSSSTTLVAPDSVLRFILLLFPTGVTTAFSTNLNWLLCLVMQSLLYPFYYGYHHYSRSCGW